jgi:CBS domain containing-hemolysin-like protein
MVFFILGVLLALGALTAVTLHRTYRHVPVRELKRLARSGDDIAALLYKPAAYGMSLDALLSLLALLLAVLALVCVLQTVGVWLAVLVLLAIGVVGGLVLVPGGELNRSSVWLARRAAPALGWLLERLHPVFDFAVRFVRRHRPLHIHTGLYEKADLVELLDNQKNQPDNRIAPSEIELLKHSLTFGDKTVADALVPKRVVKLVSATESIGPVLMDELARSGHSRFPVYEGKRDHIIGILRLRDLVGTKHTGSVASLVKPKLTYVHEEFTLLQTLQAFLRTKQHLFLVVNSFEEFVGIITIEDVLEQMIGKPIVDEFDRYDDLRAVAAAAARKEHAEHKKDKTELTGDATAETSEVVK